MEKISGVFFWGGGFLFGKADKGSVCILWFFWGGGGLDVEVEVEVQAEGQDGCARRKKDNGMQWFGMVWDKQGNGRAIHFQAVTGDGKFM